MVALEEILRQLQARFSLLTRVFLREGARKSSPQPLPPYFGIFLAVLEKSPSSPICFVLPRHGDVARVSAVLFAMDQLVRKQVELTRAYAESRFHSGDLVRIHPGKQVFRYGGYDSNCPDRIWLLTVDNNGRWQVPASTVVSRLERTKATRPVGRLNSPILCPPPTPLDLLLETSFSGNLSLVKNEVLILDSISGFESFTEECEFLAEGDVTNSATLKSLLPFGNLVTPDTAQSGWFKMWGDQGGTGEPIIAITHSAELLANYCIDAPARSKLVIVNGLGHLRHLQAYDDISQTQMVVLFADHDNEELIDSLGKRGCRFWVLDERELLIGGAKSVSDGVLGSVARWASNYAALSVDNEPCEDARLDDVFSYLDKFRSAASRTDDTLSKVLYQAWGLFLHACSVWTIPSDDERNKILERVNALRKDVKSNSVWFSTDDAEMLNRIADGLTNCFGENTRLGASKGAALLRVITNAKQSKSRVAILARNETQVEQLRRWLSRQDILINAEVFSPRTLPIHESFDRVICVSWFGGDAVKQVTSKLAAPIVTIIGYPCERLWLKQFQVMLDRRNLEPVLSGDEKTALISREQEPHVKWPEDEVQDTVNAEPTDGFAIWDLERRLRFGRIGLAVRPTEATDTVPARYVRFSGDCYAFLTETHKVPVATDIASARNRPKQKLPEHTIHEIRPGDFLVFPESGERELIQELADRLIGSTAGQLRSVAHMWQDALKASGLTPDQFLGHARALNRQRHPLTIRNWFADVSQIGPREKDDLVLIAIVTRSERLESEIEVVWSAIEQLRSAHLSAGVRLRDALLRRLPQAIGEVEENGSRVDLGELGSAWIVRVEAIEAELEPRGRGEINRLLFEKDNLDLSDLLGEVL